jgi:DNA polymerase I
MRLRLNLKDNLLASDTETTGLNPWGSVKDYGFYPARPFAFSFCDSEGNTDYIRWEVKPATRQVIVNPSDFRILKDLYSNPHLIHIGHNFIFDYRMINALGISIPGKVRDTLIMAHIITGGSELAYGLKFLGNKYLEIDTSDEKELRTATIQARHRNKKLNWYIADDEHFGKDPIKADYWMADPEICKKYAVQDSVRTMLFNKLWYEDIVSNPNLFRVWERETRLTFVTRVMENRGVKFYYEESKLLVKEYETYIKKQLKIADTLGGKGLNFSSHKQMTQKFYIEKKFEPKYNKRGGYVLNKDKLIEIAQQDPLAQVILNYRGANHMISSFLKPYDKFKARDEKGDWILHPSFKQCGPVTGRYSCGDPSLMCVASEDTIRNLTQVEYKPKRVLGPRKDHLWYLPDYKQIEVWVFAFLAKDETMMQALLTGRDFHGEIARQIWGNEPDFEEKYDSYRKRAKLILFCKFYGGGSGKVMFLLNQEGRNLTRKYTLQEAEQFIQDFETKLPGVAKFMKRIMNEVEREGVIYNPFGRMYKIDPQGSYKGTNYMIQGTSADIMKTAMLNVYDLFQKKWKGCYIVITLHDELILEIPIRYHSKQLMRDIILAMQSNFHTIIGCPKPLPISMEVARDRWSNAKEVKLC